MRRQLGRRIIPKTKKCQPDFDAGIARITQLMTETKAELEQIEHSSERTIAVAHGTIRKLNRERTQIESTCSPNILPACRRPKRFVSIGGSKLSISPQTGSLTARNMPRKLSPLHGAATARSAAKSREQPSLSNRGRRTPKPPPAVHDEDLGLTVREHLEGSGFDCWGDILLSCHTATARSAKVCVLRLHSLLPHIMTAAYLAGGKWGE